MVLDFKSYLGKFCPLLSAKESHSFFSSTCFIFHTSQFDPCGICLVCGGTHVCLLFSKRLTSICIWLGPSQMVDLTAKSSLISPLRVFLPVFACFFCFSHMNFVFIISLFSSRREKKSFWYFYTDPIKFINSL